jgi:hypothetical protein
MAATEHYSVLRPSDLVSLTIRSTGLQDRTGTAAVNELELAGTSREQGKASTLELPWRLLLAIGRCHVG